MLIRIRCDNPSASPSGPQQSDQDQWAYTSAAFLWKCPIALDHPQQIGCGMTRNHCLVSSVTCQLLKSFWQWSYCFGSKHCAASLPPGASWTVEAVDHTRAWCTMNGGVSLTIKILFSSFRMCCTMSNKCSQILCSLCIMRTETATRCALENPVALWEQVLGLEQGASCHPVGPQVSSWWRPIHQCKDRIGLVK